MGNQFGLQVSGNGFRNIKAIEIDVTHPCTILSARNIIENEQGKLYILINNAGIIGDVSQDAAGHIRLNMAVFYSK
jgi:short-subunit dehydrogenase